MVLMSDRICGAQNPRNTVCVCTKEEGHEGRHGRPDVAYRSVFWHLRPTTAKRESVRVNGPLG